MCGLLKLIELYTMRLQAQKRYSKHTLRAYRYELGIFYEYITKNKHNWKELSPIDVSKWIEHLHSQKLSPRSTSRNLTTLRVFFDYLMEDGKCSKNPFHLFSAPKASKTIPTTLTPKEMLDFLESMPVSTVLERRNKCILMILYTTGMRAEELCALEVGQVFLNQNHCRVLGKGNKERVIPLIPVTKNYITKWLEERSLFDKGKDTTLFLSRQGNKLTIEMIGKIISKTSIGQYKQMHAHAFRYTFASHLLDNQANLRYIQELLGHANLSVTQRYTKVSVSSLKQKFFQFHPRA